MVWMCPNIKCSYVEEIEKKGVCPHCGTKAKEYTSWLGEVSSLKKKKVSFQESLKPIPMEEKKAEEITQREEELKRRELEITEKEREVLRLEQELSKLQHENSGRNNLSKIEHDDLGRSESSKLEQETQRVKTNNGKLKFLILAVLLIVLGVSSYFIYNWYKIYSFNQKVDSLIGQYSMVKSEQPFQEVLRASSNPRQVNSFDDFKTLLVQVKSGNQFLIGVFYNTNDRVIYFTAMQSEVSNGGVNINFYMVYYIEH